MIGRTEWDEAYAAVLAPNTPYARVARILRPQFYQTPRRPRRIARHSIFIGNANHLRKGAHVALAALQQLTGEFPDARLVIAGEPPASSWREWKKAVGYPAYLGTEIAAAGLADRVRYTGVLSADEIVDEMRRAHVFLLSSLIENSPNTLGEAMMLGLACVCAYAGGAPDMAEPDREALFYRAEDPVCLAHQIGRLFRSDPLAEALGERAQARARTTHDPIRNRDRLLAVYRSVLHGDTKPMLSDMAKEAA